MKTKETALTDLEEVLKNLYGKKDAALLNRIQARSRKIRDRVLKEHGVLNVAVDLVREGRDE